MSRPASGATRTNPNPVDAYARDVVEERVPAGKYHRLACQRHLRDREREATAAFPYRFDLARAQRFFRFAERLRHYKGEWAGQLIRLQPHQQFRLGSIFGWVHMETGLRRFRNAYHELPRKQGKSLEAAVVTLYVTFADGEAGAEGYCTATKREQALIVFRDCKKLVESSGLRGRLRVQASNISEAATSSKLEPLSADYNSMDGLNPNMVNIDELHAHKTRGLIDVMETATGARRQPLINKITTAGDDPVSPCGDEHDYACKILDGVLEDETYFAFIAHADVGDDWTLPATAAKANPNYGVSVNPEDLVGKVRKALGISAAEATYKQKHLNLWVNTSAPWLSVEGWRKGQSTPDAWRDEDLYGERCYVGIDLASKIDLCAVVFLFEPTERRRRWRIIRYVWTPEETLVERARRDRAPYDVWVKQGHLLTTPGPRIDQAVVRDTILTNRERFQIDSIGYDPWHAGQLAAELTNVHGFTDEQLVEVPQTYQGMSNACLLFEAEVLEGRVDARSCPLMAWSASNAVVQRDGKDNIFPVKKKSRGRIDPLMATIIARRLAVDEPTAQPEYQILVVGGR